MAIFKGTKVPVMVSPGNLAPPGAEGVPLGAPQSAEGGTFSPQAATPPGQAGAELEDLIGSLGLGKGAGCGGCASLARQMDAWGPAGCRAHRGEILERLRGQQKALGWLEAVQAGAKAAAMTARGELPWLGPRDPAPGLLDEAIRRAVARAAATPRPKKITRVEGLIKGGSGEAFNASLFRRHGQLLMAYRTGWKGAQIHVARMSEDLQVLGNVTLRLSHPRANHGCEDPRLFEHGGDLWCAFIGVRGQGGVLKDTHQLLARLNDDLTVAEVVYPEYDKRRSWEKNWLPFSCTNDPLKPPTLFAIYSLHPWVVLRVEGAKAAEAYRHEWRRRWSGGAVRGGACPVLVDGELWLWFHGKSEPRYDYSAGVLVCEASPPFRPRRMTPDPVIRSDPATKPPSQYCPVVFVAGGVKDGDRWRVSCGVHDRWSSIYELSHQEIEKAMVKIP